MDNKLFNDEAKKLGIKIRLIDLNLALFEFKYKGVKRYRAGGTNLENKAFAKIFARKDLTYMLLKEKGLPIPKHKIVKSLPDAEKALEYIGFPCVVKATVGAGGFNVFTHINSISRFRESVKKSLKASPECIIEELLTGNDYRFLATDKEVLHVVKRIPARIFGDGKSTIKQLIEKENKNPWRGSRFMQELVKIKIDKETTYVLSKQGKNLNSVPKEDEEIVLKTCCNQCKGGEVETVENVHPEFVKIATEATKHLKAVMAGVDIMADDVSVPVKEGKGKIIEINDSPGIQIHQVPTHGQGVNIARKIFEVMFDTKF